MNESILIGLACTGYAATVVIAVASVYIAVKVRRYTRKYY